MFPHLLVQAFPSPPSTTAAGDAYFT